MFRIYFTTGSDRSSCETHPLDVLKVLEIWCLKPNTMRVRKQSSSRLRAPVDGPLQRVPLRPEPRTLVNLFEEPQFSVDSASQQLSVDAVLWHCFWTVSAKV